MKVAVRLVVCLSLLSGAAYAEDNPYMPDSSGGYSPAPDPFVAYGQRQQFIQNMLAPPDSDDSGNNNSNNNSGSPAASPKETPVPSAVNDEFQELRGQQADATDAIAREKMDREREIQALKDAFDGQIRDMQRKIDEQQTEIDNLRYQSRF